MKWFGRKKASEAVRAVFGIPKWIRARFDAAQTTKDNARHWAAAEFLSADAEAALKDVNGKFASYMVKPEVL